MLPCSVCITAVSGCPTCSTMLKCCARYCSVKNLTIMLITLRIAPRLDGDIGRDSAIATNSTISGTNSRLVTNTNAEVIV